LDCLLLHDDMLCSIMGLEKTNKTTTNTCSVKCTRIPEVRRGDEKHKFWQYYTTHNST
jgi:hypothetical protein